jgi:uncharacterized UBP type Zn finger protein
VLFAVSFDNYMQHDAHEFLNYLLNTVADLLQGIYKLTYMLVVYTFDTNIISIASCLIIFLHFGVFCKASKFRKSTCGKFEKRNCVEIKVTPSDI